MSGSSRTTAIEVVSRLRGSQLKNHVDGIVGRYSQHHWYLLSKQDDPSSMTPTAIALPKVSITTTIINTITMITTTTTTTTTTTNKLLLLLIPLI